MNLGIARRIRHLGGRLIRRWGLLPAGDPDGLGDDDLLRGQSLPFSIMVFFADTRENLYQLQQWYGPLLQLNRRHRVGVVCLDSRTAAMIRAECDLPVVCCGRIGVLEELVFRSDVSLCLYVNHNVRNLHPLRFLKMVHVYLGHGESDKAASASNQVKAYDFVLVAGDAGRERLSRNLMLYDADKHVRTIGRPQLDDSSALPGDSEQRRASARDGRPAVVYAPTWEGGQPSMAYSSVVSHGEAILRSLLESGEFRVTYRPHPRTGANRAEYAEASQRLQALVLSYAKTDPAGGHDVDLRSVWNPRRSNADLLIADVSAVAGDWMTTGRPLLVTVPASPDAFLDADNLLNTVPGLRADEADHTADVVRRELAGGDTSRRRSWVAHTMGDISDGASMTRFLTVCGELVELRDRELAARATRWAGEKR